MQECTPSRTVGLGGCHKSLGDSGDAMLEHDALWCGERASSAICHEAALKVQSTPVIHAQRGPRRVRDHHAAWEG